MPYRPSTEVRAVLNAAGHPGTRGWESNIGFKDWNPLPQEDKSYVTSLARGGWQPPVRHEKPSKGPSKPLKPQRPSGGGAPPTTSSAPSPESEAFNTAWAGQEQQGQAVDMMGEPQIQEAQAQGPDVYGMGMFDQWLQNYPALGAMDLVRPGDQLLATVSGGGAAGAEEEQTEEERKRRRRRS